MHADESAPFPAFLPRYTKPPTVEHSHTTRVLAGLVLAAIVDLLLHDPGARTVLSLVMGATGALVVSVLEYYRKRVDAAGKKYDVEIRVPRTPRLSQEPGAPSTPPARADAGDDRPTPPTRRTHAEE